MKKKIVVAGVELDDYFIEYKNKQVSIYSTKTVGIRKMSIPSYGKAKYPKIKFRHDGVTINVDTHRVIAENLVTFPRPQNITEKDWNKTPETVKSVLKSVYFVNHIDHDKYNCHPSNLEWVTPKQNVHAFHKHKKSL